MNWAMIKHLTEEQIEQLRGELERAKPGDDVRFIQGKIASLRWILSLTVTHSADPNMKIGSDISGY